VKTSLAKTRPMWGNGAVGAQEVIFAQGAGRNRAMGKRNDALICAEIGATECKKAQGSDFQAVN
jgi:hypothetical protein